MTTNDPPSKPKDDEEPATMDVEEFDVLLAGALGAGRPDYEDEPEDDDGDE